MSHYFVMLHSTVSLSNSMTPFHHTMACCITLSGRKHRCLLGLFRITCFNDQRFYGSSSSKPWEDTMLAQENSQWILYESNTLTSFHTQILSVLYSNPKKKVLNFTGIQIWGSNLDHHRWIKFRWNFATSSTWSLFPNRSLWTRTHH